MMEFNMYKIPVNRKSIYKKVAAAVIAVLAIIGISVFSGIYLNVIETNEIGGYSFVYLKNLWYDLASFGALFVLISILLYVAALFAKRNLTAHLKEKLMQPPRFIILPVVLPVAAVGAWLNRALFTDKLLKFMNAETFGKTDPLFNKDIGYFLFQRPFLMEVYNFIYSLWIFVIIFTVAYYAVSILSVFKEVTVEDMKLKPVLRHNLINVAILFLIQSFSYIFKKENILYSNFLNLNGAGYTDSVIWLNYYRAVPFLLVAIVIISFIFIYRSKFRHAITTILVFPAVWVITAIVAALMNSLVVSPNEINYQRSYISYNMTATRDAYNISGAKNIKFPNVGVLTPQSLTQNPDAKNNIRVVDFEPTLDSNLQLQSIKNFYTFTNGDIIDYKINGKNTPIFITARELDSNKLPDTSYISTNFKYTHGYGVVINPINTLTGQGQVDFILSGLDMRSIDPALKINQPRIYFGEQTKNHVIVNSKGINEIDYDGSAETRYTGQAGIKLSFFNKLLYAMKYGDFKMLISGYINADTKLLLNRDIIQRIQKAAPFLMVDSDPYITIAEDGSLKWIVDAYTYSDRYPYSQMMAATAEAPQYNYIRNSVKVIIDAYEGTVDFYIIDQNDPIIKTYDKMYPGLFKKTGLPEDAKAHSRYPEELFKTQTMIMLNYHLDPNDTSDNRDNVQTFYNRSDLWDIPKYTKDSVAGADQISQIEPYYNLMQLPEGQGTEPELVLMRPFTPSTRDNMISWLAVRNSAENYGEMIMYNFQKNTNIFGPNQVEMKINQIDKISTDMTLWGQSGSSVYKGSLLVIPFESSILYVEPIYIQAAAQTSIPEVREIVVGYQNGDEFKYGIGVNLNEAIANMFGTAVTPGTGTGTGSGGSGGNGSGTGGTQAGSNDAILQQLLEKYATLKSQLDELGKLLESMKQ